MLENVRIVTDSSSDVEAMPQVAFASAPLKIITFEKEYVDDALLDVEAMAEDLASYKGRSSTSCPNPQEWLSCFGEASYVFCVTITGTLSGSYNAALAAKELYEEAHPDRQVFVLNSLSAGPEIKLILEKIAEFVKEGKPFEDIAKSAAEYAKSTALLFMLESMKNLANNGRVSPIVAKAAGLLGIRVIGKASDKGDLEPLDKCRGEEKALEAIVRRMKELGYRSGKVRIAHCMNENAAKSLKDRIVKEFEKAQIEMYKCRGLCSFYAEKGGMLVGFEK